MEPQVRCRGSCMCACVYVCVCLSLCALLCPLLVLEHCVRACLALHFSLHARTSHTIVRGHACVAHHLCTPQVLSNRVWHLENPALWVCRGFTTAVEPDGGTHAQR